MTKKNDFYQFYQGKTDDEIMDIYFALLKKSGEVKDNKEKMNNLIKIFQKLK